MKAKLITLMFLGFSATVWGQNVGIGSTSFTPNASSVLELRTTTSGFLMPRMTQAQRDAIVSPAEGLLIYQTSGQKGFMYYNGSAWVGQDNLGNHTATANIRLNDNWLSNDGTNKGIRVANNGNVGVGVASPLKELHVVGGIRVSELAGSSSKLVYADGNGVLTTSTSTVNVNELVDGNGVLNYVARWTPDGNSLATGVTYDNGTNVGIGTTAPTEKLHVNGKVVINDDIYDNDGNIRLSGEDDVWITMDYNNNDNDTRAIRFGKNSMTAPTELMRIAETGNVGIGTSNPTRLLSVGSPIGATMMFTREDGNTNTGELLGELLFDSIDDTSPSTNDASVVIRATASEEHGNSNKGGNLSFFTKPTGTGLANPAIERLTIRNNGNIGVGSSNPTAKLDIMDGNLRLSNGAGVTSGLQFQGTGTGVTTFKAGNQGGANINYTLPASQAPASGHVLMNNGGGQLEWVDISVLLQMLPRAVEASSSVVVDGDSYVNLDGMSMANLASGNYVVQFNADVSTSNSNTTVQFVVALNGTEILPTVRNIAPGAFAGVVSVMALVTVSANGTLTIKTKENGSGTGLVKGRTMMIIRVG